jgi:hypothetical protein
MSSSGGSTEGGVTRAVSFKRVRLCSTVVKKFLCGKIAREFIASIAPRYGNTEPVGGPQPDICCSFWIKRVDMSDRRAYPRAEGGFPMPDMDIVERGLTPPWRSAYKLIKGQHPRAVVEKSILQALANQLRSDEGAPALIPISEAVVNATSLENAGSFPEALLEIERRFSHSGTVKTTAEAGRRLLRNVEAGNALPGLVPLAQEHCWGLIDRHLFGRMIRFVGTSPELPTFEALRNLKIQCRSELAPEVHRLARRLATDPSASQLRAPAMSLTRPTTNAVLEEPLL